MRYTSGQSVKAFPEGLIEHRPALNIGSTISGARLPDWKKRTKGGNKRVLGGISVS